MWGFDLRLGFRALDKAFGNGSILTRMAGKMTIEKLVQMTQNEFSAVRQEMRGGFSAIRQEMRDEFSAVRQEMRGGFREVQELVGAVLKVVENVEGRVGEVHSLRSVDIPEIRTRLDMLEEDMKKVKVKVHVR